MKALKRAKKLQKLIKYKGGNLSKLVWEVRIESIIQFMTDLNEQNVSRLGKLQRRQTEVYGGYELKWNRVSLSDQERIRYFIGDNDEQENELQNLFVTPQPFVMCVKTHTHGTRNMVHPAYNTNNFDMWPFLEDMKPIPRLNMLYFTQSLERCEFNAHLITFILLELKTKGNLIYKSEHFEYPGNLTDLGIAKGLATIQSNPLQIPFSRYEFVSAQTVWDNKTQDIKEPGNLYQGKLPHVVVWLDFVFSEDTPTKRYYLDVASSQINIFDALPYKLSSNLSYFEIEETLSVDEHDCMKMFDEQITVLRDQLSDDTVYTDFMCVLEEIDKEMHTSLHKKMMSFM